MRIRIEAVSLDSTTVKVHPDGTGALKKTDRKPSASRAADGRLAATQSPASSTWRFFVDRRLSIVSPWMVGL